MRDVLEALLVVVSVMLIASVLVIVLMFAGFVGGIDVQKEEQANNLKQVHQRAIDRGLAEYKVVTGEVVWLDETTDYVLNGGK